MKKLKKAKKRLVKYLEAKLAAQDWHGVRDACVDIEVIEAKILERHRARAAKR